jgi:hypothetical protein
LKQVHTTIPDNYFDFAKRNKLSWNQLIKTAIEQEMQQDPDYCEKKVEESKAETEKWQQRQRQASERKKITKQQTQALREGLMPVE